MVNNLVGGWAYPSEKSWSEFVSWDDEIPYVSHMRSMVLVYLPTKLGHKNGLNVGIHIPAPWVAYGLDFPIFIAWWFSIVFWKKRLPGRVWKVIKHVGLSENVGLIFPMK